MLSGDAKYEAQQNKRCLQPVLGQKWHLVT